MKKDVVQQYDKVGENYVTNQRSFFSDKEDWTRNHLRAELKKISGGKVLDIGCGGGDDIKWCEEKGIEAHGVDPSEKMLDLAKKTIFNPERLKIGSYEELGFGDNEFDLVMGRYSLHYLENFDKAYKEIYRVLKPEGVLLLVVSHPTFDAYTIAKSGGRLVTLDLYNGNTSIQFPPHSIHDYFSNLFLSLFDLKEIYESSSVDAENPMNLPETMYFKAIKRLNEQKI